MSQGRLQGSKNKPSNKSTRKMWVWHCQIPKTLKIILVENIMETHYEYEDENPSCHSEAGQIKDLQ